jgi:antitoxin (DNA-binding transcriptional repressor) of toxin-antitoxin stability system
MLELRTNSRSVVRLLRRKKERIRLTYRGKPLADLVPVDEVEAAIEANDPLYTITEKAVPGPALSNEQIDESIYGEK